MKKLLLSMTLLSAGMSVQAQRLTLYEEFSGENCAPCAAANPGLNTLLGANTTKVVLLKYQSPIPSAGPIYYQNTTDVQARLTYYSVPFAPYGRLMGTGLGTGTAAPSSPGHVANLTQNDITTSAAAAPQFNITATHAWSTDGSTMNATVTVTPTAAMAANSNMKLRAALVEHLHYATAPGTNGETDFHNVMRKMYPDANGTAATAAWVANTPQTFTITGAVPSYLDKTNEVFLIVWLQNDNDKSILAVGKSSSITIATDAGSTSASFATSLVCATGTASATPTVTLKNAGTTPLTSAVINWKLDNGSYTAYNWTGNIAAGGSANVTMPAVSAAPGVHMYTDSVVQPNGQADINLGNSTSTTMLTVHNNTGVNLPISTGFESTTTPATLPTNWLLYDANGNGDNWVLASGGTTNVGHNNSKYLLYQPNFGIPSGDVNYAILPHPNLSAGAKALDFWQAYAQYQNENDKLEVVYSTNCGSTWTSVWSKQGADLATAPATTSNFVPSQSQWKLRSVDMTNVPQGAMVAFRATSAYGNNVFVDDVNFRTGTPTAAGNVVLASDNVTVFPNPSRGTTTIEFSLTKSSDVKAEVVDATGRVVLNLADSRMDQGTHKLSINTAELAAGLYNIRIQTINGLTVNRLSVIK